MSVSHDCGGDAAAYVLGALDTNELAAFRRHLDSCSVCREEIASMQQLVDSLPESAPQQRVPRALRRRVLAEVRADARRAESRRVAQRASVRRGTWSAGPVWQRPAFALGGVAALAAAVVVGIQVGGSHGTSVYGASVGNATLRVTGGRGELIVNSLPRPKGTNIYEVWLKRPDSRKAQPTSALFSVTRAGRSSVDVPGQLSSGDAVMVTEEPAGGTQTPTSAPVVVAQVS